MKQIIMVALVTLICVGLCADEAIDAMDRAKTLYKAQDYTKAMNELNYAINQIHQKQAERYQTAFPAVLSGWDADEFSSDSGAMSFVGGGIAISRTYRKGDSTIDISVVSDSPLISSVMMMFSNPIFLGANKLVTVNGERAIEVQGSNGVPEELQFVIDSRILITVQGYECTRDELYSYARGIDFNKLKGFLK